MHVLVHTIYLSVIVVLMVLVLLCSSSVVSVVTHICIEWVISHKASQVFTSRPRRNRTHILPFTRYGRVLGTFDWKYSLEKLVTRSTLCSNLLFDFYFFFWRGAEGGGARLAAAILAEMELEQQKWTTFFTVADMNERRAAFQFYTPAFPSLLTLHLPRRTDEKHQHHHREARHPRVLRCEARVRGDEPLTELQIGGRGRHGNFTS